MTVLLVVTSQTEEGTGWETRPVMMSAGLCCQLGFESRESEPVPLLWLGVLIRQLESDTTAGWSEIRLCCTGLGSLRIGQL